ncbi:MAG TPA: hypothetical protein VFP23_01610 [Solirubrobacterales bacterium]|nr:hypothetical protein [Solirubrobacterales bacterium]
MAGEAGGSLSIDRSRAAAFYTDGKIGLVEVIAGIAAESDFTVSKPALAERLGQLAVEEQEHDGETREILDLAEHLLRLAGASRILRGRLRS